jgi:carbamoyl-phosphate synthase small subunit
MPGAFGTADEVTLKAAALAEPGTDGIDLVDLVSTAEPLVLAGGPRRIVAYDYGIKTTMLRHLNALGEVTVVPASMPVDEVLALRPDGVFLSNGPGDPAMVPYAVANIRGLVEASMPTFGICLGHQLLSLAVGGATEKLPFGHHGGNHPVRRLETGAVEITSQNHNFAVMADSLTGIAEVTHVNLNDGVCEGMRVLDAPAFSVQYHPEAGPGPHDARYLFALFDDLMGAV